MRDHPTHPGALHYIIHAYDDPAHAKPGTRRGARVLEGRARRIARAAHDVSYLRRARDVGRRRGGERSVDSHRRADAGHVPRNGGCLRTRRHLASLCVFAARPARRRAPVVVRLSRASAKSGGAAAGYAEMRLQYVVDAQPSEPALDAVRRCVEDARVRRCHADLCHDVRRASTGRHVVHGRAHRAVASRGRSDAGRRNGGDDAGDGGRGERDRDGASRHGGFAPRTTR